MTLNKKCIGVREAVTDISLRCKSMKTVLIATIWSGKKKKTAYFAACRRQRAWRLGSASLCQQFPRRGRRHKRRLCIFHRQRWLNVSAVQP